MTILKCKMCGGDIELSEDKTFGTCECCGSTMTFPKIDDEQRAAAFNRGNHFRRIGEFDKALSVYERIVEENSNDAEAHWCCALCRFGIEYVEDPATFEYIPTCHRASFDIFTEDVDYLAAVEYSDGVTKNQYQKDAIKIVEVQKGILATSQSEEPFDAFICYKETDENENRTVDSTLAQDIYYQLTDAGLRVFFARITLEDKAGSEYEPYIFAALNSAKAMIVVGTKPEYFNAVWVKNEWSRYLSIVKRDRSKVLLPCYKNMDPYDLPEQLSVLQSYDMTKIGFIQDLIRGVRKVVNSETNVAPYSNAVIAQQSTEIAPLLKRAFMYLEDADWSSANEYCERVLDHDPECAEAYLCKLMVDLHVKIQEDIKNSAEIFDNNSNYKKIQRFGDASLNAKLAECISYINERNENARLESIYFEAIKKMEDATTESDYESALGMFNSIPKYKDATTQATTCAELAESARKDTIYAKAESLTLSIFSCEMCNKRVSVLYSAKITDDMGTRYRKVCEECLKKPGYSAINGSSATKVDAKAVENIKNAILLYRSLDGWKDTTDKISQCLYYLKILTGEENVDSSQPQIYRIEGKCQHCGGAFVKKFLSVKCSSCGKPKDY